MAKEQQPSGRFVLRMAPEQHARLRAAARAAGLSLNEYCIRQLALPAAQGAVEVEGAVAYAREVVAEDALVGVVAFGSWARGDFGDASDVDLLIVVDQGVPITRELYRQWDTEPPQWDGRAVEPHFVHLPEPGGRLTGLWAEVALDGIVVFEQGFAVSRRLARIRAMIAEGAIVRRKVHGQSYWVAA